MEHEFWMKLTQETVIRIGYRRKHQLRSIRMADVTLVTVQEHTLQGKTITCFVDGKEYIKYDVLDLNGNKCELRMYMTGSDENIKIKCVKE